MPENEFERRVHEEMDGLRLRPSASVWESIEDVLQKKKKRRVVFYISLLAGLLLLGYPGYLLLKDKSQPVAQQTARTGQTSSPVSTEQATNTNASSSRPIADTPNVNHEAVTGTEINPLPSENDQRVASTDHPAATDQTAGIDHKAAQKTEKDAERPAVQRPSLPSKTTVNKPATAKKEKANGNSVTGAQSQQKKQQPVVVSQTGELALVQPSKPLEPNPVAAPKGETVSTAPKASADTAQAISETVASEAVADSKDSSAVAAATPAVDSAASPVAKKKSSSKIKWAVDISAGLSGSNTSSLLNGGNNAADYVFSGPQGGFLNNGGLGAGAGVPTPVVIPRSDVKAGAAFRVGFIGELSLSKRSSLSSGIQYQYMSTRMQVGSYADSLRAFNNFAQQSARITGVYVGVHKQTFTNRYHFIQVPLQYRLQIGKGDRMPFSVMAGLTAAYLVSSNALVYSSSQGGIYYHSSDAFNRFNVNLNTGFSLLVGKNKRMPWSIGPEFSFDLTRMFKEAYDQQPQYLFYGGIGAKLYLPKSKN